MSTSLARTILDQFEADSSPKCYLDYRDQEVLVQLIDKHVTTLTQERDDARRDERQHWTDFENKAVEAMLLRKERDQLQVENTRLHEENRQRVESNIARQRPLSEEASHYALYNTVPSNAPYGALEMAFIQGANWQKGSGT